MIYIKITYAILRYSVILLFYYFSKNKSLINMDIDRWINELHFHISNNKFFQLSYQLLFRKDFRNLFYFRCNNIPNIIRNFFCKPDTSFYIADCIPGVFNGITGGGLYMVHSFGTRIRAKEIGIGCIFRQLTTIGTKSTNKPLEVPIIKNNVDFGANVSCFGNITIGNNAIIGAGSVVVKDVPDNAIVAGNPAKIIGYRTLE